MKQKGTHGKIFRKLRKERNLKLKDVAGAVVSPQTLRRFETGETSVPLSVFERLLQNVGITFQDFLLAYQRETLQWQSLEGHVAVYMQERNFSAVLSFCKDYLARENLDLSERVDIAIYARTAMASYEGDYPAIIKENERFVFEHLQQVHQYSIKDYALLAVLFEADDGQLDFSIDFIQRIVEEILVETASVAYDVYMIKELHRRHLLRSGIKLIARKGYLDRAEQYCWEAIEKYKQVTYDMGLDGELFFLNSLLASFQLQQNRIEGVMEANKVMQMLDARIALYNHEMDKQLRQKNYERFYRLNQTGQDFLF